MVHAPSNKERNQCSDLYYLLTGSKDLFAIGQQGSCTGGSTSDGISPNPSHEVHVDPSSQMPRPAQVGHFFVFVNDTTPPPACWIN